MSIYQSTGTDIGNGGRVQYARRHDGRWFSRTTANTTNGPWTAVSDDLEHDLTVAVNPDNEPTTFMLRGRSMHRLSISVRLPAEFKDKT